MQAVQRQDPVQRCAVRVAEACRRRVRQRQVQKRCVQAAVRGAGEVGVQAARQAVVFGRNGEAER